MSTFAEIQLTGGAIRVAMNRILLHCGPCGQSAELGGRPSMKQAGYTGKMDDSELEWLLDCLAWYAVVAHVD